VPIGVNIGKNKDTPNERAAEDYLEGLERLYDRADFFVVNVSSPNTPGLRDLQAGDTLAALLRVLREKADALAAARPGRKRPLLFVKVSPDETDYQGIVDAAVWGALRRDRGHQHHPGPVGPAARGPRGRGD
jgi:dihydroorotate dehydrogenase